MSTLQDDAYPEPDPREITSRVRSYMGDKKISRKALALSSGIGRTPLGAKLDDQGQFTLTELLAVARALGKSWLWVMTGDESGVTPPLPPHNGALSHEGANGDLLLPRLDSNQEPSDLLPQMDRTAA